MGRRLSTVRRVTDLAQGTRSSVRTALVRALVVAAIVISCVGLPVHRASSAPAQGAHKAKWTVLWYITADTENIEHDLLVDVENLALGDPGPDVNIVALIDRIPGQDDDPVLNLPNFDTAKLVKLEHGQATELQDVGEVDMGDGQTLAWFLATGMSQFPAEHYMVTIDDHGSGVNGSSFDDSTPPVDGHASHLDLDETTAAVQSALQATGVSRIDLFNYAACLMANFDAAAKLAPLVDYLIASEEVSVGPQADATDMLKLLKANPNATAPELGASVVDTTTKLIPQVPDQFALTMSVIDLRALRTVTQALESFATAVSDDLTTSGAALGRAQSQSLHFGMVDDKRDHFHVYDIGDLLAHLQGASQAVMTARNALYEAEKRAVLSNAKGGPTASATGMSIYFPATKDEMSASYPQVAASSAWAKFLVSYFDNAGTSEGSGGGTTPAFTSHDARVAVDANGALVSADLVAGTEGALASADFFGGVAAVDGTIEYVFMAPAQVGAGGPLTVAQAWALSKLQLTDGKLVLDATVNLSAQGDGLVASIPVIYQTADGDQTDAALMFLLDANGDPGLPVLFQFDADGGASKVTPAPGSIIAPLVFVVPPGGDAEYRLLSDQGLDATAMQLAPVRLATGSTFVVALRVSDAAGNGDLATAVGTVP
jgi:hypothetical protein